MTLFESFHLISFLRNQSELVRKCQCCSEHTNTKHCCKISKQTCILFSFSTSMYWIRLMYKYKWVIICIFFLDPTRADKHTTYRWHAAALSILCALSSVLSLSMPVFIFPDKLCLNMEARGHFVAIPIKEPLKQERIPWNLLYQASFFSPWARLLHLNNNRSITSTKWQIFEPL